MNEAAEGERKMTKYRRMHAHIEETLKVYTLRHPDTTNEKVHFVIFYFECKN